jgi:hypothetical protein
MIKDLSASNNVNLDCWLWGLALIGSGWSQIFKGNIGDIAIWSKAITAYDEKSSLLSSYASLLGDPDLKYLWSASSLNSSGIKSPEFINLKDSNNNLNIVNLKSFLPFDKLTFQSFNSVAF